jgi:hypothetical protein
MEEQQRVTIVLVSAGVPLGLARLWLIWWRGECRACGRTRSSCSCPIREPGL